jgi:hypothetical protein
MLCFRHCQRKGRAAVVVLAVWQVYTSQLAIEPSDAGRISVKVMRATLSDGSNNNGSHGSSQGPGSSSCALPDSWPCCCVCLCTHAKGRLCEVQSMSPKHLQIFVIDALC